MASSLLSSSLASPFLAGTTRLADSNPTPSSPSHNPLTKYALPRVTVTASAEKQSQTSSEETQSTSSSRRSILAASVLAAGIPVTSLITPPSASALIPTTAVAGRIPGLSEPDENGWRTYKRPLGKSGGHGIGWSELIPYSFKVPEGWEEIPVSIADLGGTEIDLRFVNSAKGKLAVIVAPVLRFNDTLGNNATMEKIGTPERVINAFGPEVIGESVEGKVKDMEVIKREGLTYYNFEVDPHYLLCTTAAGNRLYIMALSCNGRQWKKYGPELKEMLNSFRVG